MSSRWLTGNKSEVLAASPAINELARIVLDSTELDEAENVAFKLASSKREQREAKSILMDLVAPPPRDRYIICNTNSSIYLDGQEITYVTVEII